MITLLIYILIFCLFASLVWYVINRLALPEPVRLIVVVIMAIIGIVFLLSLVGGVGSLGLTSHPLLR
jgi:hypothetical protein